MIAAGKEGGTTVVIISKDLRIVSPRSYCDIGGGRERDIYVSTWYVIICTLYNTL